MKQRLLLLTLFVSVGIISTAPVSAADRMQITVSGGWGFYQMDNLNDHYIDDFARPFGFLEDDLNGGMNFQIDLDYFVMDRVTVGIGASYISGASKAEMPLPYMNEVGEIEGIFDADVKLTASAFAPHVRAQYIKPAGSFNLILGAGIAYLFGKSDLSLDASRSTVFEELEYTADGFGFFGNLGVSRSISSRFSITVMSGYRVYKTGDLEDGGEPWIVDYSGVDHKIDLDFSGPYLMAGVSVIL